MSSSAAAQSQELSLTPAFSLLARLRGLLGHSGLEPNQGLWIRPCNSVHSCFMSFSIDVLYLNRQKQVIRIHSQLRPWRFSFCGRAHSVIELAAGEAARLGIRLGDTLSCEL